MEGSMHRMGTPKGLRTAFVHADVVKLPLVNHGCERGEGGLDTCCAIHARRLVEVDPFVPPSARDGIHAPRRMFSELDLNIEPEAIWEWH
ncbi:hypothetical protein AcV5_000547 [Taiwanofungus camphoratus]|nr:hypothetical protein AcV5_000547 [Antrodia cinnamomea]